MERRICDFADAICNFAVRARVPSGRTRVAEAGLARKVDGKRIKALRKARAWTQEKLANRAGLGVHTVIDAENGKRDPRGETVKLIAAALDASIESLFIDENDAKRSAPPAAPPPEPPALLAPPTKLKTLVVLERDLPALADHPTPSGPIPMLRATLFQSVTTAWATYEDARFCVAGHVETHDPISREEARELQTRRGVGARFHIVVPIAPGHALGVTVVTRDEEQTRALLAREGKSAKIVVRVVIAADDEEPFVFFLAKGGKAWTLVVESVEE